MSGISASTVMKLRKMSGQGMMDCKKALAETNGDIEKAIDLLRKKGLATLSKRAERDTSEGLVVCRVKDDGKAGVMTSLCCETDFVSKSDGFIATASKLLEYAEACSAEKGSESVLDTELEGKKFNDVLTETVSKIGEKIQVGDYQRFSVADSGLVSSYIHFNGKVGAMVLVETSGADVAGADNVKAIAADIAMHITATKPAALDKDGIDADVIEREKGIFAEQVKNKPPEIVEKIVEGKMRKFFAENCLLEQPFVKDDSKSVGEVVSDAAKQAGGEAIIKEFVRFEVG